MVSSDAPLFLIKVHRSSLLHQYSQVTDKKVALALDKIDAVPNKIHKKPNQAKAPPFVPLPQ